jgi:hypothetical protein
MKKALSFLAGVVSLSLWSFRRVIGSLCVEMILRKG